MQPRIHSRCELSLTRKGKGQQSTGVFIWSLASKLTGNPCTRAAGAVVLHRDHTSLPATQWRGGRWQFEINCCCTPLATCSSEISAATAADTHQQLAQLNTVLAAGESQLWTHTEQLVAVTLFTLL